MLDQFRGALLGAALGEAWGRGLLRPVPVNPGGAGDQQPAQVNTTPVNSAPGNTTPANTGLGSSTLIHSGSGTELQLAVLESYVDCRGFDPIEMSERFLAWYRAAPRELEPLSREALENLLYGYNFERAGYEAWQALPDSMRRSDASLARALPTGLLRYHDHVHLIGESRVVSGMTHHDERCKLACVCLNLAVAHLMLVGAEGLLDELLDFIEPRNTPIAYSLRAIPGLNERELRGGPDCLDTLQSALWAAIYCDSLEEALRLLAPMPSVPTASDAATGDGERTVLCAVAAALLGARLGTAALPQEWIARLALRGRIEQGAGRLFELCEEA